MLVWRGHCCGCGVGWVGERWFGEVVFTGVVVSGQMGVLVVQHRQRETVGRIRYFAER